MKHLSIVFLGLLLTTQVLLATSGLADGKTYSVKLSKDSYWVVPSDGDAKLSVPTQARRGIYVFPNGNRLIYQTAVVVDGREVIPGGIYFNEKGSKEAKLLVGGGIQVAPTAMKVGQGAEALVLPYDISHGIAYVLMDGRPYVVAQSGSIKLIPYDLSRVEKPRPDVYWIYGGYAQHGGESYSVMTAVYQKQHRSPGVDGETWIIRTSDLKMFCIGSAALPDESSDALVVEDGILSFAGASRKIDLERFDMEARFESKVPRKVVDAANTPVDAMELFNHSYLNLSDQARRQMKEGKPALEAMDRAAIDGLRRGLAKSDRSNVALLGPSGTGKTQLVRTFARMQAAGAFPEIPRTWDVVMIDKDSLGAGTKYVGEIESRLQALGAVAQVRPVFLFMDEIHSLRGLGTHSASSQDVFQTLKPLMAEGQIRIIGASTAEEFSAAFAGDTALVSRFTVVQKSVPAGDELLAILNAWIRSRGKTAMTPELLKRVVAISTEFNATGAQPLNSIALLEEIYADLMVQGRSQESPSLKDIQAAAQKHYRMDPAQFDLDQQAKRIVRLQEEMDSRVIGQDAAKAVLVDLARQAVTGVQDPLRPKIRAVFAGPKGAGKSELAKAYAEGMGLPAHLIEMNRFTERHPAELLVEIAAELRKNPFTVLIFDEVEKANPYVQNALLGLMNEGVFHIAENGGTGHDGFQRIVEVSARNATIIFTTNAGQEWVLSGGFAGPKIGFKLPWQEGENKNPLTLSGEFREAVIEGGVPEFLLDRAEAVIPFDYLDRDQFRAAVQLHFRRVVAEMQKRRGLKIAVVGEEAYLDSVVGAYFRPNMSNREILRLIQAGIRSPLGNAMLSRQIPDGSQLVLEWDGRQLTIGLGGSSCDDLLK